MTARSQFSHEKLVRSRTAERLERRGAIAKTRLLELPEYITNLEKKLIEEVEEVAGAPTPEQRISELADVLEIIHALSLATGFSIEDVEHIRQKKLVERGGFDQRIYCEYVEVSADSDLATYYRENHYPETPVK